VELGFHGLELLLSLLDLTWGGAEYFGNESGHAVPLVGFGAKLVAADGGELVELCLAIVVGFAPLAGDETLMFEAVEGRIEGTLLDGELLAGDLLDAEKNTIAVKRTEGDGLEDEHVKCALDEVELVRHRVLLEVLGETLARFS
jgi:hypothetical protein